jgi:hypothetical protein
MRTQNQPHHQGSFLHSSKDELIFGSTVLQDTFLVTSLAYSLTAAQWPVDLLVGITFSNKDAS